MWLECILHIWWITLSSYLNTQWIDLRISFEKENLYNWSTASVWRFIMQYLYIHYYNEQYWEWLVTCRFIIQTHYTKSISILTFLVVHVTFVHISVITAWRKGNTCRIVLLNYHHWNIFLSCGIVFGYIRQMIYETWDISLVVLFVITKILQKVGHEKNCE